MEYPEKNFFRINLPKAYDRKSINHCSICTSGGEDKAKAI